MAEELDEAQLWTWLATAAQRLHHNVLATALANKLARIAWTVLAQNRTYETRVGAGAA
jgi:transposase